MKAVWNGATVAESDDIVTVEGNAYFPHAALRPEFFQPSDHGSHCPWKGDATYYTLTVNGRENQDAAWCYEAPKAAAQAIAGRVAFWKGVSVTA